MDMERARANLNDASGGTRLPADVLAATFKEAKGKEELTKEETIEILDQQISAFSAKSFQQELWKEFPHDDDILEKRKKVDWLSLPIKGKISEKYGYGSDLRGVKKCESAMMEDDPEVEEKMKLVEYLINPDVQKKKDGASAGPIKATQASTKAGGGGAGGAGTSWVVVGGGDTDGILVREGVDLNSPKTSERLATGAEIEELQLVGARLQFKKVKGNGPETGWVSLEIKGKALVERKA